MNNAQVKQEAQRISECCSKIQTLNSSADVQQEVQRIKDCCAKIEQSL